MLKVANNKLVVGKEEYYAFSAEMHYFRVNKRHWSICFERIRKAGFRIISTCVPWNLHEFALGEYDFFGTTDHTRDLVVFLELAREFGFKVILCPGPYINSDWKNGGYPDFLYNYPEILAKGPTGESFRISDNKTGQPGGGSEPLSLLETPSILTPVDRGRREQDRVTETSANEQVPNKGNLIFTPLHPRYMNHVKRYLAALSDIIKNYIYPKGPVVMVKLDNGLGSFFGSTAYGDLAPFKQDYNEQVTGILFPEFLQTKYGEIKKLSHLYGEKYSDFKYVKPPVELKISQTHHLIKYFDWISFKEWLLNDYVLKLKEIYLSFEVPPLFYTDLFLSRDLSVPFGWKKLESDDLFVGIAPDKGGGTYVDLVRHLRYFSTCCSFPWSSEFPVGSRADVTREGKRYFPVTPRKVKFLLTTALSSGIKGFNYHMFVGRDHWYDAPLANDGTIQPNFELIKKFTDLAGKIGLSQLKSSPPVGLASYRPYLWFDFLTYSTSGKTEKDFSYLPLLISKTHPGLSSDLINLKINFGMPDLWLPESLKEFSCLLVPCAEFMDGETQKLLISLAKEGKNLILFGLLPRLDLNFKECSLLCDSLKMRSKEHTAVGKVEASGGEETSYIYGHLRGVKKSSVLAKHGEHPVGAVTKLGKGHVFVFTFDISAEFNHHKLSFLEDIFHQTGIQNQIYCDAPQVDLIIQKNDDHTILYLINPISEDRPAWSGNVNSPTSNQKKNSKKIILRFDPRKLGIKGKKLRLLDLLGDDVIKTSPEELKTGIILEIASPDSRMYLIEGK
jgi:beta-galactosidase